MPPSICRQTLYRPRSICDGPPAVSLVQPLKLNAAQSHVMLDSWASAWHSAGACSVPRQDNISCAPRPLRRFPCKLRLRKPDFRCVGSGRFSDDEAAGHY